MLPQSSPGPAPLYVYDAARPERLQRALDDLGTGLRRWRLGAALAWLDIRNRYRGSVLGPFWMTISTALMIAGLGWLYSSLFKLSIAEYLPFLAISLLLWNTINQTVMEGCGSLTGADGIIRQMPLPFTVHVLRSVLRNAIFAAHSLPLILLVLLAAGRVPPIGSLLAIPGLLLIVVNAFFVTLFLGMICARFRDIGQIVTSAMQLFFFISPVIWKPELLSATAQTWLLINPFYVLMETVRGPLLDGGAPAAVWISAVLFTLVGGALALGFFVRFRGRIAFWV